MRRRREARLADYKARRNWTERNPPCHWHAHRYESRGGKIDERQESTALSPPRIRRRTARRCTTTDKHKSSKTWADPGVRRASRRLTVPPPFASLRSAAVAAANTPSFEQTGRLTRLRFDHGATA